MEPDAKNATDLKAFDGPWPVVLGVGLGALFAGAVTHWALLMAGLNIFLVGLLGMAWQSKKLKSLDSSFIDVDGREHPLGGLSTRKLGMWIFLASEVLFFTGLIGASLGIRARSPTWPEPGDILNIRLTAANTFILICSSMTMVEALRAAQAGNQRRTRLFLLSTLVLGSVFIAIQGFEYASLWTEGLTPASGLYGSTFYVQTGFHGAHVSGGLMALTVVVHKGWKGGYDAEDHEGIELMGLYWHFVDVVWIFLFTVVYLI